MDDNITRNKRCTKNRVNEGITGNIEKAKKVLIYTHFLQYSFIHCSIYENSCNVHSVIPSTICCSVYSFILNSNCSFMKSSCGLPFHTRNS